MSCRIIHGEVPGALADLIDSSIDGCVTDPPYGIGFMGKEWDTFKPRSVEYQRKRARKTFTEQVTNPNLKGRIGWMAGQPITYDESLTGKRKFQAWTETWAREVLRVLKPGGYLLCCGHPRSNHRMACGVEDAGFEVRDAVLWIFGTGFPKSHNLRGKFQGWGTALKPGWEPILMARKPLIGTVAANVERFGVGALNIDASRIQTEDALRGSGQPPMSFRGENARPFHEASRERRYADQGGTNFAATPGPRGGDIRGSWPANVIHDGSAEILQTFAEFGEDKGAMAQATRRNADKFRNVFGAFSGTTESGREPDGLGSAARFFYCAKASRSDRDDGIARNNHPTVKPTELMRYLCALVTPPGGTVLDPFMGSGSTGRGALLGGFSFIGIEREAEYVEIARARIRAIDSLFTEIV